MVELTLKSEEEEEEEGLNLPKIFISHSLSLLSSNNRASLPILILETNLPNIYVGTNGTRLGA
jgi:hypothetical protein